MAENQPRWYQEAIIYELHIRAFFDSNQDGSGDFRGLVQKLDYLNEVGITAIWLLPFYPSPLKDDGYDIADYTSVHSAYGDLADFKLFLQEAHQRNIRVITELVLNHTSDQHPWFQRARQSQPGSPERDFYIWSDQDQKFSDARIIFKDFETSNWAWDPIAQSYYWHRFYSHQPDLNYDNPSVEKAVLEWVDFWLEMGVDGLRLDAVPYLFKREGTHCENLPETHQFLKKLRKHIDAKFPDRMLLAEANQWPEDSIAYFGNGDECQMAFHFPLMPRMYMSLQQEDRFPLIDILQQTPRIPETCQWSIFLRNHDELTLEMVTEEEREFMYNAYAPDQQARINLGIRRRLAPLLNNNRKKIELMNGLLFSFPGTPVIYYGDEIGMGDNFYLNDRNAVRTPMQWNSDKNAGFSQAHPHRLFLPVNIDPEYHYESINVAAQQNNPESLLSWMKKIIAVRKRHRALSLGRLNFLYPDNSKVLAYTTQYQDEIILVIVNLSRFPQHVALDLGQWRGMHLIELFSQNLFPEITETPYAFTLGEHNFYWFLLEKPVIKSSSNQQPSLPILTVNGHWETILEKNNRHELEKILPSYLLSQRWFNQKSHSLKNVHITEIIPINLPSGQAYILFISVVNIQEQHEIYVLPITYIDNLQYQALAYLPAQNGYLIDAYYDSQFNATLLRLITNNQLLKGSHGFVKGIANKNFSNFDNHSTQEIAPLKTEQSNTSILINNQLILKYYRRCQIGIHPEVEIAEFLTEKAHFQHTPELAGSLEYRDKHDQVISLGFLQKYRPHQANAWEFTLQKINLFFESILRDKPATALDKLTPQVSHLFANETITDEVQNWLNGYGVNARLLGQRTAEMHIALAGGIDPAFLMEPFSSTYQRNLYQSIRSQLGRVLAQLSKSMLKLPSETQIACQAVLQSADAIEACMQQLIQGKINAERIRIHGDFHLGQVLYTGNDFVIVDFEGEPERSLSARRSKRSPLCDVAGMLRSYDYAIQTALINKLKSDSKADVDLLNSGSIFWRQWISVYFLQGYWQKTTNQKFLPAHAVDLAPLLQILSIEKAIYEIQYELNNRLEWLIIPCRGLVTLLKPLR